MEKDLPPSARSRSTVLLSGLLPFKGIYWAIASLLTAIVIVLLLTFVVTAPPKKIVIAAGPQGSYFEQTAMKYAAELKKQGVDAEILNTAGARENIQLINSGQRHVDIAFMHGGLTDAD